MSVTETVFSVPRSDRAQGLYARGGKRVLDVVLALILLPFVLPLIGALAVLVRLDGGHAFYGHQRVGRHGHGFTCWKLRSMVPRAEDRLEEMLATDPAAARSWATRQKLEG